jgi:hypothetical protein
MAVEKWRQTPDAEINTKISKALKARLLEPHCDLLKLALK